MLSIPYYAENYAGIIDTSLASSACDFASGLVYDLLFL